MEWVRDRSLTLVLMAMFLLSLVGQLVSGLDEYQRHAEEARSVSGCDVGLCHDGPPLGGDGRELGERVPADGDVRPADDVPRAEGLAGIAAASTCEELVDAIRGTSPIDPRAVAGATRRLGAAAVRELARPRVRAAVPGVVGGPRGRAGLRDYADDQVPHGQPAADVPEYMASPRFWFESFQNWQSEFLSLAAMVWLAVYLRQRYSPESKPVHAPHSETGR